MGKFVPPEKEMECGCRWDDPTIAPCFEVLLDERLLDFLVSVCGEPFVASGFNLFGKQPYSEKWLPWHQDTYGALTGFTWTEEKASAGARPHPITIWVALDDVSCENG